ncbi:hypothetical protein Tco_1206248 [Tanacetum coccineum]
MPQEEIINSQSSIDSATNPVPMSQEEIINSQSSIDSTTNPVTQAGLEIRSLQEELLGAIRAQFRESCSDNALYDVCHEIQVWLFQDTISQVDRMSGPCYEMIKRAIENGPPAIPSPLEQFSILPLIPMKIGNLSNREEATPLIETAFQRQLTEEQLLHECDQLAMAKESGRRLGIRTNIYPSSSFLGHHKDASIRLLYVAKSDRLLIHHNGTERVGSRSGELRVGGVQRWCLKLKPLTQNQHRSLKRRGKERETFLMELILEESEETELASQQKKEFNRQMERDAIFRKHHNIHTPGTNIPSPLQDFLELISRYRKMECTTIAVKDNCNTLRGMLIFVDLAIDVDV